MIESAQRRLNHKAYHVCIAVLINKMLKGYGHNFQELAVFANVSIRTLRKIRRGDESVEKSLCQDVYYVLAEYHHFSTYMIIADLEECDKAMLEDRKEY
ncbi:MAG: hypothetical protein ILA03_02555 [Bacteroidaceae bacterium]|nr:hypothetical protein [Bacteroidaceae bacterium]